MVVNTTEERSRRIAADVLDEQVTSTWVLIEEVGDVVDEAGDDDQGTLLGLLLDCMRSQHMHEAQGKDDDAQESHEMTGRSFEEAGHTSLSWTSRIFLSFSVYTERIALKF